MRLNKKPSEHYFDPCSGTYELKHILKKGLILKKDLDRMLDQKFTFQFFNNLRLIVIKSEDLFLDKMDDLEYSKNFYSKDLEPFTLLHISIINWDNNLEFNKEFVKMELIKNFINNNYSRLKTDFEEEFKLIKACTDDFPFLNNQLEILVKSIASIKIDFNDISLLSKKTIRKFIENFENVEIVANCTLILPADCFYAVGIEFINTYDKKNIVYNSFILLTYILYKLKKLKFNWKLYNCIIDSLNDKEVCAFAYFIDYIDYLIYLEKINKLIKEKPEIEKSIIKE